MAHRRSTSPWALTSSLTLALTLTCYMATAGLQARETCISPCPASFPCP